MAKTFTPCDSTVAALAARVIEKHHRDLAEAGVTIGYLFAWSSTNAPAIKLHGWPAQATVKINSLKDRTEGKTDVTVTIDGENWADLPEKGKEGLLAHELYHLVLLRFSDGQVKKDDIGRPKLKLRPHDFEVGGFYDVAERYTDHSAEVKALRSLDKPFLQGVFQFG